MSVRQVAVHEAAHAVVSSHYGLQVVEIRVGNTQGWTKHVDGGTALQQAAITAAGEVGQRLVESDYLELACGDLAIFEQRFGLDLLWRAQTEARQILTSRRTAVLALADRLIRERHIRFG